MPLTETAGNPTQPVGHKRLTIATLSATLHTIRTTTKENTMTDDFEFHQIEAEDGVVTVRMLDDQRVVVTVTKGSRSTTVTLAQPQVNDLHSLMLDMRTSA